MPKSQATLLFSKKPPASHQTEEKGCPRFPHTFDHLIATCFQSQNQKTDKNESISTRNSLWRREAQDMILLFQNCIHQYFPSSFLCLTLFNALASSEFEDISIQIFGALQQVVDIHSECCQSELWNGTGFSPSLFFISPFCFTIDFSFWNTECQDPTKPPTPYKHFTTLIDNINEVHPSHSVHPISD